MRFKLINRATGLTLGEHKVKHPLRYYYSSTQSPVPRENFEFQHTRIKAVIRQDGAIGFQRMKPSWDDGELYWLKREDWQIVFTTTDSPTGLALKNSDDAADRAAHSHSRP